MAGEHTHNEPFPAWAAGTGGAAMVLLSDAFKTYYNAIPEIDLVLIHLAKIGGLVVTCFSLLILHRKWKNGNKNKDAE